ISIDAPMTYGRYTQGPGFFYTRSTPGGQVSGLIADLKSPNLRARGEAAAALGALGPAASAAVPALVTAMGAPSDYVRLEGSTALVAIGQEAVPALTKALRSPNAHIRRRAAQALAELGPVAQAAAGALTPSLKDKDARARCDAAHALWNVSGNAQQVVPVLQA